MDTLIRRARVGDALEAVSGLGIWRAQPIEERVARFVRVVERMEEGLTLGLVAERAGAIVGWARTAWFKTPEEPDMVPTGWYLLGLDVRTEQRRQGIGSALTDARIAWLRERAHEVRYFTTPENLPSMALHAPYGFVEEARGLRAPGPGEDLRFVLFLLQFEGQALSDLVPRDGPEHGARGAHVVQGT